MQVIVALGNPGEKYENTRHNIGWLALDYWLGPVSWKENKKFSALLYEDKRYLFVKPLTFMNDSGLAVQKLLAYYKLLPKKLGLINKSDADLNNVLTVIHDDLDLNFGNYKISTNSGSAGHNGVKSIINHLKTKKFTRLRIGIKNELLKVHIPPEKFVLSHFSGEEQASLSTIFTKINIKTLK